MVARQPRPALWPRSRRALSPKTPRVCGPFTTSNTLFVSLDSCSNAHTHSLRLQYPHSSHSFLHCSDIAQGLRYLLQPRILDPISVPAPHHPSSPINLSRLHLASLALTFTLDLHRHVWPGRCLTFQSLNISLSSCSVINSITEFFHPHTIVARLRP